MIEQEGVAQVLTVTFICGKYPKESSPLRIAPLRLNEEHQETEQANCQPGLLA